ncbi:hypothetical protein [Citrobacter freundii]|uniref:hypothetical protein n=1 Tax=Citrobacter freundii TaxID=546 RepID=UPI00190433EA|nr:hypothetical protein [Citrobacter freundii]MBJ8931585.1 hypothetical protein [Citrobacter freundii]
MHNKSIFHIAIGPIEKSYSWYLKIEPSVSTLIRGHSDSPVILSAEDVFQSTIRFAVDFTKFTPTNVINQDNSWCVSVSVIVEKNIGHKKVIDKIIPGVFTGEYHEYPLVERSLLEMKALFESSLTMAFENERNKLVDAVNLMVERKNVDSIVEVSETYNHEHDKGLLRNLSSVIDTYINKFTPATYKFNALTVLSTGAVLCVLSFFYFNTNSTTAIASETALATGVQKSHIDLPDDAIHTAKNELPSVKDAVPVGSAPSNSNLSEFMASGTNDLIRTHPQASDTQQVALVKETLQSMGYDLSKTTDTGCLVN